MFKKNGSNMSRDQIISLGKRSMEEAKNTAKRIMIEQGFDEKPLVLKAFESMDDTFVDDGIDLSTLTDEDYYKIGLGMVEQMNRAEEQQRISAIHEKARNDKNMEQFNRMSDSDKFNAIYNANNEMGQ